MKTSQIRTYLFEQLGSTASKQAVMDKQKKLNNEMEWANLIIEDFIDSARFLGFTISKVMLRNYANFNENDGIVLEGTWKASEINLDKLRVHAPSHNGIYRLSGYFKEIFEADVQLTAEFKHNGDKNRLNNTAVVYSFSRSGKKVTNASTALAYIHELENHLFHRLHNEWSYRNNREFVIEEILEDESTYDQNGIVIKV